MMVVVVVVVWEQELINVSVDAVAGPPHVAQEARNSRPPPHAPDQLTGGVGGGGGM